mgnify:CR=1 FL=1
MLKYSMQIHICCYILNFHSPIPLPLLKGQTKLVKETKKEKVKEEEKKETVATKEKESKEKDSNENSKKRKLNGSEEGKDAVKIEESSTKKIKKEKEVR